MPLTNFPNGITSPISTSTVISTGSTTARTMADRSADVAKVLDYIDPSQHAFIKAWDVASQTGSLVRAGMQDAIDSGKGRVFFSDGVYAPDDTVDMSAGVILEGPSAHIGTDPGALINGSKLSSGPILRVTGGLSNFLHHGGILRLGLGNGPGDGFFVDAGGDGGGVGETFFIDQVQSNNNGGDGFHFEGNSTPLHIGRISVHKNGGSGLYLKENVSHIQVQYVAGDDNTVALVEMEDINSECSINIIGWKSERSSAIGGHPDIFKLVNCLGGYVHIGPGHYTSQNVSAPNAIVNISSGNSLRIDIDPITKPSSVPADYTYGVENSILSKNITPAQLIGNRYSTVASIFYPRSAALDPPSMLWEEDTYLSVGAGTPEGSITAGIGSIYLRRDGGAGTSFYVKESGAGNTGWVAK